jgi:hypothetical protein
MQKRAAETEMRRRAREELLSMTSSKMGLGPDWVSPTGPMLIGYGLQIGAWRKKLFPPDIQSPHVANIAIAAVAIAAVASHPSPLSHSPRANSPMTFRREAMSMIIAMIGTAATPLMTALQKSALIGSSGEKFMAAPTSVAAAIAR